jgi:DNA-binding NarL/FixJ family response regulator
MNGMEFVTEVQKHAIEIPIVIVSNSASDTKVKTMLALGVKKYILKAHHRLEEIITELQTLLKEIQ